MQQAIYTPHQQRPLRPGLRGLHALHQPDPALSRPAGAPRDQGAAATASATSCRAADAGDARRQARGRRASARKAPASRSSRPRAERRAAGLGGRRRCTAAPTSAAPTKPRRDVEAWLKCHYMREHLGEEFGGAVTAVDQLRHLRHARRAVRRRPGAHHRARRRVLPFDEARQELRGERTGIRYAVGTRVRVQVSRVDLDGRKIDFRLVREGEDAALARALKRQGARRRRGAERGRRAQAGRSRRQGRRPRRKAKARSAHGRRGRRAPARRRTRKTGAPRKRRASATRR